MERAEVWKEGEECLGRAVGAGDLWNGGGGEEVGEMMAGGQG